MIGHVYEDREPPYYITANRWNFLPDLFNKRKFTVGAEIGVDGGRFSKRLCETVKDLKLYAIDPWYSDRAYRKAKERLTSFNCEMIKKTSGMAVQDFGDRTLDFVYIDMDRRYDSLRAALDTWSWVVKEGGIISGCCYYNEREAGRVKDVVDDWTKANNIDPWFILTHPKYPCYLWENP